MGWDWASREGWRGSTSPELVGPGPGYHQVPSSLEEGGVEHKPCWVRCSQQHQVPTACQAGPLPEAPTNILSLPPPARAHPLLGEGRVKAPSQGSCHLILLPALSSPVGWDGETMETVDAASLLQLHTLTLPLLSQTYGDIQEATSVALAGLPLATHL